MARRSASSHLASRLWNALSPTARHHRCPHQSALPGGAPRRRCLPLAYLRVSPGGAPPRSGAPRIACRQRVVAGRSFDELLLRNRRIADACRACRGPAVPCGRGPPRPRGGGGRPAPSLSEAAWDARRRGVFDKHLGFTWGTKGYLGGRWRPRRVAHALPDPLRENEHLAELGSSLPAGKFLLAHFMRDVEHAWRSCCATRTSTSSSRFRHRARRRLTWAVRTLGANACRLGGRPGPSTPSRRPCSPPPGPPKRSRSNCPGEAAPRSGRRGGRGCCLGGVGMRRVGQASACL